MPFSDAEARKPGHPPLLSRGDALFVDFDGTLVELAPTPADIHVPAGLPGLLTSVSGRLGGAVALVSGRRLADLVPLVAPFAGAIVGQHGSEIRYPDGRVAAASGDGAVEEARVRLAPFAARHRGIVLEDKGAAVALHYRGAPDHANACRAAARDAVEASGGGLRAIDGNRVVELVPRQVGKGGAIALLVAETPFIGRVPVFVGDDATDEDGFAEVDALGGISVKVGGGRSVARYRLPDVAAVLAWIARGA
ncbi:MAG TPA: trehalose-phosphatase [Stellaceae bacterium]|jgi:trehalose 6-phosphate phosphatase|nr:trehalose-phosphatase [Stellaceae bacterium]